MCKQTDEAHVSSSSSLEGKAYGSCFQSYAPSFRSSEVSLCQAKIYAPSGTRTIPDGWIADAFVK